MRPRLAFGIVLLALAAMGWLLLRTRERDLGSAKPSVPAGELSREEPGRALGAAEPMPPTLRETSPDETRSEPLPEEPSEIVVQVVDDGDGQPVRGAEIFALEVDEMRWPLLGLSEDESTPDIEATLQQRGRRLECDEHGIVRLPIPPQWWAISARKDELFDQGTFGADSSPNAKLRLVRDRSCRVRIRDSSGHPVPEALVELYQRYTGANWRGRTDKRGEVVCRQLGWLLAGPNSESDAWCATVNVACVEPPCKWFQVGEPIPETIELVVPESQPLRLRIAANDGTPVPVGGKLNIEVRSAPGRASAPRIGSGAQLSIPLRRGEALVRGLVPGASIAVECELAGGEKFWQELLLPATDPAPTELVLRMPDELQVLLARLTDEAGIPLVNARLEWNSFALLGGDELQHAPNSETLQSDEQGQLAIVLSPADPYQFVYRSARDREEALVWHGYLRTRSSGRELVSAAIPFAAPGAGAVRHLGALTLAPDSPLVSGRVIDAAGKPLTRVCIGLVQFREATAGPDWDEVVPAGMNETDCARTDSDGRFALHGTCSGAKLRVNVERAGYALPRGVAPLTFEPGGSPDLAITLVRNGALRCSVLAGKGLDRPLRWVLEQDEDSEPDIELSPDDGGGLLERTMTELRPGNYRVRLEGRYLDSAPGLVFENVTIRSGELTLDPRLLRVDVSGLTETTGATAAGKDKRPVVLRVLDSQGLPVLDGSIHSRYADMGWSAGWHGGRIAIPRQDAGSTIAIWSPGFRAWTGECPESSGEVRLEPALALRVHVQLPPELRRVEWHFSVMLNCNDYMCAASELLDDLPLAELDGQGMACFECPGTCRVTFDLVGRTLDPSSSRLGEYVWLETSTENGIMLSADRPEQRFEFQATPEEWAALEKGLRARH